jgi:hypothetical protein
MKKLDSEAFRQFKNETLIEFVFFNNFISQSEEMATYAR